MYDFEYEDDLDDESDDSPPRVHAKPNRYVVAIYELDKSYGGSEEGGWWYDTGNLNRVLKTFKDRTKAVKYRNRLSHWLERLNRRLKYGLGSVCYGGGHWDARIYEETAPRSFPDTRPHYEKL